MQAVADAAGVSKTTVSHVLSGRRPVAAKTKRNVLKVMQDLGFQPNYFAQALSAKRSLALALIVQDLTNPYYPTLGRGLQLAVGGAGYVVMLFDAGAGSDMGQAAVKAAIQRRVDGVVIAVGAAEHAAALDAAGIAAVAVGAGSSAANLDWVSADDERIARDAVAHLYGAGYRRIATIAGPPDRDPGGKRLRGYRDEMTELGLDLDPSLVAFGDWTREGGSAAMAQLLEGMRPPSAVFCANDLMAIGALDVAHERGLRVPQDLAISGVDDIDAASLVRPTLTTIRIPALEIGRAAGNLLLSRIADGDSTPARHVLVQHSVLVRQSA